MLILMLVIVISGIVVGNIVASFVKPKKVSNLRGEAVAMDIEALRKIESEALKVARNNTTFMKLLNEGYMIKEIKPVIEAEVVKIPIEVNNSDNVRQYELTTKILPLKLVKIVLQKNNESISVLVRVDLKKVVNYDHQ